MARILIAEDEAPLRGYLRRGLQQSGHDISAAADGAEALEVLREQGGAFDLLLADIKMPVMDGVALALAAAPEFPDLTILLMSGHPDQRVRASGLEGLIHGFLPKPFTLAELNFEVASALAARRGSNA
jgi:two-component system, cell cycle response regulator CpdR